VVVKKGVEVSRLRGAESIVGKRGKFESYALLRYAANLFVGLL